MWKKKSHKSSSDKNDKVDNVGESTNQESSENLASKVKQFESVIDDLPHGTVLFHENGVYFNKEVEKMIGYTNDEIKDIDQWHQLLYKDDTNRIKTNNFESEIIKDIITKSGKIKKIAFKGKLTAFGEIWGLVDLTELFEARAEKSEINQEFKHLLDFSKIGLWEWVIKDDKLTWDKNMYEIFGFEEVGVVSKYDDYKDRLHPDDAEAMKDDLNYIINNPIEEFNNSFRVVLKDGTIKKIKAVAKTYRNEKDKLVKMVGLNWDITEEEAIHEQRDKIEEDYKFILSSLEIGVWEWDINADKLDWNDTMYDIFGYDRNKIVNSIDSFNQALHPDDAERVFSEIEHVIKTPNKEFDSTFRIIRKDGEIRYIRAVSQSYRGEDGIANRAVGLNWDVTKENELEEEGKKQREDFNFIINSLEIGIWDWDVKSDIMTWSDNMFRIYGFEIDDKYSNMHYFKSVLHPDDIEKVDNELEQAINTPNKEFEITFRVIKNNGDLKYIHAISRAYRDEHGIATRIVGLNWDVTKENELEEEKKELTEKYDFILGSIEIGIWDWDIRVDKLNWNDTMYEVFGYNKDNKVTSYKGFREFLHPEDLERVDTEIADTINSPSVEFESNFRILLEDGTIKHIRSVSKAYRNEAGKAVRMAGISMNITKEIELKEDWKELTEKYELILNNTKVGVWDWDVLNNKITRSKTIFELFELPENDDDSFDGEFNRFRHRVHPEDLDQLESDMESIVSGKINQFESELRVVTPSGNTKHIKSITSREKDEDDNLVRVYGIFLDNTKIKEYELELVKSKEEAEAANKSKSNFLANMSHEIRTPMNAIMGLTYLTQKTNLNSKQKDYLDKIQKSSSSLLGILNDILDFSKVESGILELESIEIDLDDVLESVSDIITYKAAEKGLEVIFSVGQEVPRSIISDPLRIKQIILNLCSNAVKFTEKGQILLEIKRIDKESDQLELKVIISDTGIGMKEEQIKNLFTPFTQADSSTTRKYGGSGLGLVISKNLVELLGGEIGVESEYGKGSNFSFTFKCKEGTAENSNDHIPHSDMRGLKVLVCDDNQSMRNVLKDTLSSFAFDVTTVENGFDAIREIEKEKLNPYDLVLIDSEMPKINGIDTIREINKLNLPRIPTIIMITAYSKEEILKNANDIKFDDFLTKPITSSVLFDTIIKLFKSNKNVNGFDAIREIENTNFDRFVGKKVLLVEDNEINQLVANELLLSVGMIVDIANDGDEAIQMAKTNSYDIVLMDLHMPGKDGYEATKAIRRYFSSKELPIIAMTADAMADVRERCLKVGMDDFLTKPINVNKLFEVITYQLTPKLSNEINSDVIEDNKLEIENNIDGIDIEFGLNIVGGNKKLYIQLLSKFNNIYQNFFDDLMSSTENDRSATVRKIHTLKGVAGNLGAKKLYDLAEKYMDLMKKDFVPNRDNMNDLKLELEKVLNSTSAFISDENGKNLITNSNDLLLEKKDELEALLKLNEYKSLKVIKEILKISEHLKYEKEFNLIHKYIKDYEFEKALTELNKLKLE